MKKSSIIEFLTGYEASEKEFSSSKISRLEQKFKAIIISGFGASHAKKVTENPIIRFFTGCARSLSYTPLRAFGALLLTFSLLTLIINLAGFYLVESITVIPLISLIAAAVAGVVSVPLLLFDTPFIEAIQAVRPIDNLLFEVLCLKRTTAKRSDTKPVGVPVMVFVGVVLSVFGFFIPMHITLISLGVLVFLMLAFASPEFSFMLTLLSLPAIQLIPRTTLVLLVAVCVSALSFMLKVMMGKRSFHFEQYDLLISLMMAFVLLCGLAGGKLSFLESASMAVLALAYPLASNLIANRRLADNAVNLILFSSVPTAIYGIIRYFTTEAPPETLDPAFRDSISSRAAATFSNPNVYAVFLIVTIVFSFVLTLERTEPGKRACYFLTFVLNTFVMVLTWTRGAWLALILAIIAAAVIGHVKIKSLLIPIALLPIVTTVFGSELIDRLLSSFNTGDTSVSSRLSIWRSSLLMIKERPLLGYGVGSESFKDAFLPFAEDGVSAVHSHNLFLQIAIEAGGFALLLFLLLLLSRIRHISTYAPYVRISSISSIFTASAIATFALVAFGMTDYIFYNKSMYFLFFAIFGMTSAALRISRQDYIDRHIGLGSESSAYSSEVDISIIR